MVDRVARDCTALLLRRLMQRRITEKEFDTTFNALSVSGKDRIFEAIFEETFSISSASRRDIARWILFLQSGSEYVWPNQNSVINPFFVAGSVALKLFCDFKFHASLIGWLLATAGITVGLWRTSRQYKSGDLEVWPFHQQAEFEEAKHHPRLLASKP